MTRPSRTTAQASALAAATLVALAGCGSLPPASDADALRQSVMTAVKDSLVAAQTSAVNADAGAAARTGDLGLSEERTRELQQLSGPESYQDEHPDLGPDLLGRPSGETPISLARAAELALAGDTDARAARLDPPITRAQIVQAEAAFDWVLFAEASRGVTDQEQAVPIVGMNPVGTGLSRSDEFSALTGLRKRLTTNGTLELSTGLDVFNNATPGFSRTPDPARTASLDLLFTQPLLREFGADVALAEVRLAENANEDAYQQTRDTLISTLTDVENAYWNLRLARERLLIQERLLARGIDTREALRGRLGFDVTDAEIADAAARVEARRAQVIRAQRDLRDASDELKRLINDADTPLTGEAVLVAADAPLGVPVSYDLEESIARALDRRPDVRRALIQVRNEAVRERVAKNAVLPQLDLTLRLTARGLDDDAGEAFEEAIDADFVDAAIGLTFEYPLANREALAGRRAARLRSLQSSILYRSAVRRAIQDVKAALRTVATNYRLIEQTRVSRLAAAENLRALRVEEETIRGLTPDFLNLKLNRQEALAQAELEEAAARVDYASALAEAARALGLTLENYNVAADPNDLEQAADDLLDRARSNPAERLNPLAPRGAIE